MQKMIACKLAVIDKLNIIGSFLPQLAIRLFLATEFWVAGLGKYNGANWFANIQSDFPFPFSIVPTGISWFFATWTELLGAIALVIGLATRFTAFSLIILDLVAWHSIHAGHGYNVCDNGYKLPLIYLILFLTLLFSGPGKASLDYWIRKKLEALSQSVYVQ